MKDTVRFTMPVLVAACELERIRLLTDKDLGGVIRITPARDKALQCSLGIDLLKTL